MVKRYQRLTRFFSLLTIYCICGGIIYYCFIQAYSGNRGVEAKNEIEQKMAVLQDELTGLRKEKSELSKRLLLMKGEQIDKDLLEERARIVLGQVHRNEIVIMLNQP